MMSIKEGASLFIIFNIWQCYVLQMTCHYIHRNACSNTKRNVPYTVACLNFWAPLSLHKVNMIWFSLSWTLSFSTPRCNKSPKRLRCNRWNHYSVQWSFFPFLTLRRGWPSVLQPPRFILGCYTILIFAQIELKSCASLKGEQVNFSVCFSAHCILQAWWSAEDMPRCTRLL